MCVYGVCVYAVRCMSHGGRSRTSAPQGLPAPRTASRRRPDPAPRTASGRAARPRAPHGPARPRDAPLKRGEIMVFFRICVLRSVRYSSLSIFVDLRRSWSTQVALGRPRSIVVALVARQVTVTIRAAMRYSTPGLPNPLSSCWWEGRGSGGLHHLNAQGGSQGLPPWWPLGAARGAREGMGGLGVGWISFWR